jgi:hypothetical protein
MGDLRIRKRRNLFNANEKALAESSPEKAGVGGSIPSLATTF